MSNTPNVRHDNDAVVLHVPVKFKRRAGRKQIVATGTADENGVATATPQEALASAVARAHRWLELMESGRFASMSALARHLGYDRKYVVRFRELTLLRPELVEAILAGHEPSGLSLEQLAANQPPPLWTSQGASWSQHA